MSWKNFYRRSHADDNFEWVEPLNKAMECLIDVLSYIDKLDNDAFIFASLDNGKYIKNVNMAVKSYLTEANKLIATLLSFHTGASRCTVTGTGWRDESEYKKLVNQAGHSHKSSSFASGLDLTVSYLRDIGALLSLHAKVLKHLKIN
jgi:hypothetical protein